MVVHVTNGSFTWHHWARLFWNKENKEKSNAVAKAAM
jgi:hypothetical protein